MINDKPTKREREIIRLIAYELTTEEIAERLNIGLETVKSHRRNLLLKMEVKNTAGLVRRAFEQRILSIT